MYGTQAKGYGEGWGWGGVEVELGRGGGVPLVTGLMGNSFFIEKKKTTRWAKDGQK